MSLYFREMQTPSGKVYYDVAYWWEWAGTELIYGKLTRCVNDWSFAPANITELSLWELKDIVAQIEKLQNNQGEQHEA